MLSAPFEALQVGAREVSRGRTVTEADVVGFAALTGDRHPLHVDAAWAGAGPFGERVAHGLLVLSYAAGLVAFDPARVLALRAVRDAVFKRPVRLGDTIAVETRIAALDPVTGTVTCEWRIRNQAGRLVARATVEVLWRRDAPAAEGLPIDPSGLVHALESVPL
ncbi:MAG TPA: MaoC/PaaZ C-terminal domain-containing protein [Solirubrobacteraceae bacterium]|jgi:acyl dehydratase